MTTEVRVPELGESVVEATVAEWLKQEGDRVAVGDVLLELETDKVNLEVGAETDGVLEEIRVAAGEDVAVGDVLATIAPAEETAAAADENGRADEASRADDAPAEPAPEEDDGAAETREAAAGAAARENGADGETTVADQVDEPAAETAEPAPSPNEAERPDGRQRATPVARRVAEAHDIDVSEVEPSGSGGRVTRADVERHVETKARGGAPTEAREAEPRAEPREADGPTSVGGPVREARETRQRLSRRRRTIAKRLVEAQHTAAMLTTFNEIDMGAVMALRARRKQAFAEQHDVKLGLSSFFVKAVIGALRDFPELNAELDGDELVLKHYHDIGIAIGAEEGLVVPVLRDADRLSFAQIERQVRAYAEQASSGDLSLADLRGGTFTITNGGVFGSMLSTPILNPPQVGILGLHKIEQRPVVVDGEVVVRRMMYVALTYDHRVVDGREAVQFLVRVKELVEDPERLLLEG